MEEYCDVVVSHLYTCYQGAVNYHLFILGDEKLTKSRLCDKFEDPTNQLICIDNIRKSEFRK
jgi:hypothetical protein